jgi:hypothetical protein
MNTKDEENGALAEPLIFTVPAYGFVMALYLDWLGRSCREARSAKAVAQEVYPNDQARSKSRGGCTKPDAICGK